MPTAQISSPACLSAITTSAPSIPLAKSANNSQSLSRKGETLPRLRIFFLFVFLVPLFFTGESSSLQHGFQPTKLGAGQVVKIKASRRGRWVCFHRAFAH